MALLPPSKNAPGSNPWGFSVCILHTPALPGWAPGPLPTAHTHAVQQQVKCQILTGLKCKWLFVSACWSCDELMSYPRGPPPPAQRQLRWASIVSRSGEHHSLTRGGVSSPQT